MIGSNVVIKKGKILVYRVFDIAHEVNLKQAETLITTSWSNKGKRLEFSRDRNKTLVMRDPPLCFDLGEENFEFDSIKYKASISIKLWNYGALSVCFSIDIPNDFIWKNLVKLGCILTDSSDILNSATNVKNFICNKVESALIKPVQQNIVEDYTTYLIEHLEEVEKIKENEFKFTEIKDPLDVIKKVAIPELIIGEDSLTLAETTRKSISKDAFQYSKHDLVIVDWNSSLILDFTKKEVYSDYVEILDFALSNLLELRVYDSLLDEKLFDLYDSIEKKTNRGVFSNKFSKLSEEANQMYLEFSEFFDHIDNSIKTVGDSPLAAFFRKTVTEFRFLDWQTSVKEKMQSLAQVTQILQNEVNSKKSHMMELTIIVLIMVEVIPLVYSWIKDYLK